MFRWLGVVVFPMAVMSLPADMQGIADVKYVGKQMQVTVGEKAALSWKSFSIAEGELVNFIQPSPNSIVINQVAGGAESQILGSLKANGTLYLLNPSGIFIGDQAVIQVGSLVASTLSGIGKTALEQYEIGDSPAAIRNSGKISALHGDVILMSHQIENSGLIEAPKGMVACAAGHDILVSPGKRAQALVRAKLKEGSLHNVGTIRGKNISLTADGNLYSLAINQEGIVDATEHLILQSKGKATVCGIVHGKKGALLSAGELRCTGEISSEEAVYIGGKESRSLHIDSKAKIEAPKIALLAKEHIQADGQFKGSDLSFISKGSLTLGQQIDLALDGSVRLGMAGLHLGQNISERAVAKLLKRGSVTLQTTTERLTVGQLESGHEPLLKSSALYSLILRAPKGEVALYEGIEVAGGIACIARDITIGADDHGTEYPLTIRSKEGSLLFGIGNEGVLRISDGKAPAVICSDKGDIAFLGDRSRIEMRAETPAISSVVKAKGMVQVSGIEHLLVESAGDKSEIKLAASAIALRDVGRVELKANGESSQIEISALEAFGLQGRELFAQSIGEGSSIHLSSKKMGVECDEWKAQAVGAKSSVRLCADELQMLADRDIRLESVGKESLVEVALKGKERSYMLAMRDFVGLGSEEAKGFQIVERGGESGLVLYAGRDMVFDHRALVETHHNDLMVEAGRDMIWRGNPRFISSMKEAPAVQLMSAVSKRRGEAVTLSELFKKIARKEKSQHDWFVRLSQILDRPVTAPALEEGVELLDLKLLAIGAEAERAVAEHCCIERDLCRSLQKLGIQGKLAESLRRSYLLQKMQVQDPKDRVRPWRSLATDKPLEEEKLTAQIID